MNSWVPKTRNLKASMRASWTETPKTKSPKIYRAKQGSENLLNLKRFHIHVG
jgi:hypothetical protein